MDEKEKRFEKAKETALTFLLYGMHTEEQVRRKLLEKEFTQEETDEVIAYLAELRYIDDLEYAVSYIEYAVSKRHGVRRIKDEMRKRGLRRDTIDDAFYEYEKRVSEHGKEAESEDERALAEALRIADGREIDDKLIAKAGRRLKTLGYEGDAIYSALGALMKMKGRSEEDFE